MQAFDNFYLLLCKQQQNGNLRKYFTMPTYLQRRQEEQRGNLRKHFEKHTVDYAKQQQKGNFGKRFTMLTFNDIKSNTEVILE